MREFFRGWRRKVGLVTLVMTCVMMGCWIRSRHIVDYAEVQTPIVNFLVLSGREGLTLVGGQILVMQTSFDGGLLTLNIERCSGFDRNRINVTWNSLATSKIHVTPAAQSSPRPTYRLMLDWLIGDGEHEREMLPYWCPVLLLSLLSAFLILWKPRPKPVTVA